jgi:hypothetical protein
MLLSLVSSRTRVDSLEAEPELMAAAGRVVGSGSIPGREQGLHSESSTDGD